MLTLTAEQRVRAERSRFAALQLRKQHHLNVQQQNQRQILTLSNFDRNKSQNKQTQTLKPNRKRKYHQITHLTKYNNDNLKHSPSKKRRKIYHNNDDNNNNNKRPHNNGDCKTHSPKRRNIYQNNNNNDNNKNSHKHSEYKPKTTNRITNYSRKRSLQSNNKKSKKQYKKYKKQAKYTKNNGRARLWMPLSLKVLFQRLSHSKFRSKFKLNNLEINIVHTKDVESHAFDFIRNRLSSAYPVNDGKQTPMRGHPVFIAQHATATCCRPCLSKWHCIPMGKVLSKQQIMYMVEVILHWISIKCPEKK